MGSYKSAVSRQIRSRVLQNQSFNWLRNFYERIIRNAEEFDRIKEYILNNPERWLREENASEPLPWQ